MAPAVEVVAVVLRGTQSEGAAVVVVVVSKVASAVALGDWLCFLGD